MQGVWQWHKCATSDHSVFTTQCKCADHSTSLFDKQAKSRNRWVLFLCLCCRPFCIWFWLLLLLLPILVSLSFCPHDYHIVQPNVVHTHSNGSDRQRWNILSKSRNWDCIVIVGLQLLFSCCRRRKRCSLIGIIASVPQTRRNKSYSLIHGVLFSLLFFWNFLRFIVFSLILIFFLISPP